MVCMYIYAFINIAWYPKLKLIKSLTVTFYEISHWIDLPVAKTTKRFISMCKTI